MAYELEGAWEDIKTHDAELAGRSIRVIVQEDPGPAPNRPFYERATPAEWSQAWRGWTESHSKDTPLLSEEAVDRDSIYAGRA